MRTSQIARKDACLSASARAAFLVLVLALRLLPSSGPHFANERPTDRRRTTALGIRQRSTRGRGREEGRKEGRRTRGSSLNQHAEFLQGIPAPLPPSLPLSLLRSRSFLPLTKVLLGSVFHFGFLPRGKSERASERRRRGLEMLYLNEPTPSLSSPSLSLLSSSPSRFRRRRFPQTVQQK